MFYFKEGYNCNWYSLDNQGERYILSVKYYELFENCWFSWTWEKSRTRDPLWLRQKLHRQKNGVESVFLSTIESKLVWLLYLHYGNVIENWFGNETVVKSRKSEWQDGSYLGKYLRRWLVRINSGTRLVKDIHHGEWTWLNGRLDNVSKCEQMIEWYKTLFKVKESNYCQWQRDR